MSKKGFSVFVGLFIVIGIAGIALLTAQAAGYGAKEWVTDAMLDFSPGTMDGVDIWSTPGEIQLDFGLWPNMQVNDTATQSRFSPRLDFVVSGSDTHFLAVWADERTQDHYPDIYFADSTDGGRTWSSDVLVSEAHVHDRWKGVPDIAVRPADDSLWVVWQDDRIGASDAGDIYFATSADLGQTWSAPYHVYAAIGTQGVPRIAASAGSDYLYAIWEDERADSGDIYISRYNPDVDLAWGAPLKISTDTGGAEQQTPSLTVDTSGNIYALWTDMRSNDDGEIYFSNWDASTAWDAANWSANTRLSDASMDWATRPDVTVNAADVIFAAWQERVPTSAPSATYDFQIVVGWSADQGATWERSVVDRLESASASNAFYAYPAIETDGNGLVYVVWLYSPDSQVATSSILFAVSPDDGENWTEPRVANNPTGQQAADVGFAPALVSDASGQVVIAWTDYRETSGDQIYAAGYPADRYLPNGTYYSPIFDTGCPADWNNIAWTETVPVNTSIVLSTRIWDNTAAAWSSWSTHTTSGEALSHPDSNQIQYRAVFSSNGFVTPVLNSVTISYTEQYCIFLPLVQR